MDSMLRELRLSTRRLFRRPGFTVVALLSLTLGIGANTIMFTVLNAVIRHQPFGDVGSLSDIYIDQPGFAFSPFSYPDFKDLRRETGDVFESVMGAGFTFAQVDTGSGVALLTGELVTTNYFQTLGLPLQVGPGFEIEDDETTGGSPFVVVSADYWRKDLGGKSDVVGQEIRLSGRAYTIVGVAPETYHGVLPGFVPDFYAPVTMDNAFSPAGQGRLDSRGSHWFFAKARRKAGVGEPAVTAALDRIVAFNKENNVSTWDEKRGLVAVPTSRVVLNPMLDRFIYAGGGVLMALMVVVLAIACANLAGFLLARATDQRKETAIRQALGATRRSLVGQQLLDAGLLSAIGGLLGAALATALAKWLSANPLPVGLPLRIEAVVDGRVLVFCFLVSALSALLFGLAPALAASRRQAAAVLKDEGTGGGAAKQRLRGAMVLAQVALSTLLLVSAGLFARSLLQMRTVDPGFGYEPTAILNFGIPESVPGPAERLAFLQDLRREIGAIAGVRTVGITDNILLNISNQQGLRLNVAGVEPPEGAEANTADYAYADVDYFDAVGIRVVEGRGFLETDVEGSRPVAVVSQAFVERFFGGRPALGQILDRPEAPDLEVVGVSSDAAVRLLGEKARPFVFLAANQTDLTNAYLIAPTQGDPKVLAAEILRTARRLVPDLMVIESKTMEEHLSAMLFPSRALAFVFAVFAVLALLLAAIGLYGIVSCTVASRVREVGIRVSLGATGSRVVSLLMRGGMWLVLAGSVVGVLLALVVSRVMSNLLFATNIRDPFVFFGVPVLMILVAGLASLLPALRALRVNPTTALRS